MKRILITGLIILTLGMFSCENQPIEFPDFDYTTTYFPYQFVFRTLILGDYITDNTNDNNLRFLISANVGGVYENKKDITVNFVVDPSLTDSMYNSVAPKGRILPLPTSYYTLSNTSQIIIPAGKFFGSVTVQLNEAFLLDPLSVSQNYVVPLVITSSTTDSILQGIPLRPDAKRTINYGNYNQWLIKPMDFTMFGIKYVNEYHGKYLLRGKNEIRDAGDNSLIETVVYRQKYIEQCEVVSVLTALRDSVTYENNIRVATGSSPGKFKMGIVFDANGDGVITKAPGSAFEITGIAKFSKNSEIWGGQQRHAIYLNYAITQGTRLHNVKDTLVFRDKAVKFETFGYTLKFP